jgi:tripartite-type tricarboxylate transporter receptor subunit TctC
LGPLLRGAAICLGLTCGIAASANAQSVEQFYANRQVHFILGHPAGGDYDLGGRLLARYFSRHIPGHPTIVVQAMPAAASVVATNYLYAHAARDGSVVGSFSRNIPNQAILGQSNLEADPRRFFWLGAASLPSRVCLAARGSGIQTAADVFSREFVVGGSGAGSSLSIVPTTLNRVLGARFRVVEGYQGPPDAWLAMERGEIQGVCASINQFASRLEEIRSGRVRILFRAEETPIPDFPDVPSIYDFAKTDEQRDLLRFIFSSVEFGRPYVLPPGVPADRATALRAAFEEALRDPELIAEAHASRIDMTLRPAPELVSLLDRLYATPKETLATVAKIIPAGRD